MLARPRLTQIHTNRRHGRSRSAGGPSLPPSGVTHKGEDRITLAGHIILRVSGKGTGSKRPAREASLMKHTEEEEGKRGIKYLNRKMARFIFNQIQSQSSFRISCQRYVLLYSCIASRGMRRSDSPCHKSARRHDRRRKITRAEVTAC